MLRASRDPSALSPTAASTDSTTNAHSNTAHSVIRTTAEKCMQRCSSRRWLKVIGSIVLLSLTAGLAVLYAHYSNTSRAAGPTTNTAVNSAAAAAVGSASPTSVDDSRGSSHSLSAAITAAAGIDAATPPLPYAPTAASASSSSSSSTEPITHLPIRPRPPVRSTLRIQNLLPFVRSVGSSVGEMIILRPQPSVAVSDPFWYELCSFTNVCVAHDSLHLYIADRDEYTRMQQILQSCFDRSKERYKPPQGMFSPCHCFYAAFKPKLLPYYEATDESHASVNAADATTATAAETSTSTNAAADGIGVTHSHPLAHLNVGHFALIHKYVGVHTKHIAHWAQKLLLFAATMEHFDAVRTDEQSQRGRENVNRVRRRESYDERGVRREEQWTPNLAPAAAARAPSAGSNGDSVAPGTEAAAAYAQYRHVGYSPLAGMVFADMLPPLTSHESGVLNVTIDQLLHSSGDEHFGLAAWKRGEKLPHFAPYHAHSNLAFADEIVSRQEEFEAFIAAEKAYVAAERQIADSAAAHEQARPPPPQQKTMMCYARVSFTRAFGIFATSSADTEEFRRLAYERLLQWQWERESAERERRASIAPVVSPHLVPPMSYAQLKAQLTSTCPPRRALLLYRPNRVILNWQEIAAVVREMSGKELERVMIDESSSHAEQVSLFASAGLILSSHSSQLVNVMFSHPSSVMMEVTAEFYNADFAEYAHGMGVKFFYSFGGEVPNGVRNPNTDACVRILRKCDGDSKCLLRERFNCPRPLDARNKQLAFNADIVEFRRIFKRAVDYLSAKCDGRW